MTAEATVLEGYGRFVPGTILEDSDEDRWCVMPDGSVMMPDGSVWDSAAELGEEYGPLKVVQEPGHYSRDYTPPTEHTDTEFIVRDSGARQEFDTGSRRDTDEGKPRYDLIPVSALRRLAIHMAKGAKKYGDRNWELGQPMTRLEASMLRHAFDYLAGDRTEDHLSALLFNAMAIMDQEERITAGKLPAALDDRPSR